MNHEQSKGAILAVVMAAGGLVLVSLLAIAAVLSYGEYRTNKLRARARSIEVMQQIEAREAARRSADLELTATRAVLNDLRDEINANYGDRKGTPRINCGPCARFAIALRERWISQFEEKVNIVCVLSRSREECGHVALKFPDGSYYDGGNGVMSEQQLRALYSDFPLEEMVEFDRNRLDRLVGGLDHDHYPECPNYSEELTIRIIEKHLARLATDRRGEVQQ